MTTATPTAPLSFARCGIRDETTTGSRRTWLSTDGHYAIEEHRPACRLMPPRYLAVQVLQFDRRTRQRHTRLITQVNATWPSWLRILLTAQHGDFGYGL